MQVYLCNITTTAPGLTSKTPSQIYAKNVRELRALVRKAFGERLNKHVFTFQNVKGGIKVTDTHANVVRIYDSLRKAPKPLGKR